jgi:hypothetical protein
MEALRDDLVTKKIQIVEDRRRGAVDPDVCCGFAAMLGSRGGRREFQTGARAMQALGLRAEYPKSGDGRHRNPSQPPAASLIKGSLYISAHIDHLDFKYE